MTKFLMIILLFSSSHCFASLSPIEKKSALEVLDTGISLGSRLEAAKTLASSRGLPWRQDLVVKRIRDAISHQELGSPTNEPLIAKAVGANMSEEDLGDLLAEHIRRLPPSRTAFDELVRTLKPLITDSMRPKIERAFEDLIVKDKGRYKVIINWARYDLRYISEAEYLRSVKPSKETEGAEDAIFESLLSQCSELLAATQLGWESVNLKRGDIFITRLDRTGYPGANGRVLLAEVDQIRKDDLQYTRGGFISGVFWKNMSPVTTRNLSLLVGRRLGIKKISGEIVFGKVFRVNESGLVVLKPLPDWVRWNQIAGLTLRSD